MIPELSLIGLGPMGLPIAQRIRQADVPLTVWNRTAGKDAGLTGARVASSPADAAAATVLTVLPDLPQVASVLDGDNGLKAGWKRVGIEHPTLVIHGTVSPASVTEYGTLLTAEHGINVVDAPMSGGVIGAAEGRLSLMVGGDAELVESLEPIFSLYASTIARMGDRGCGAIAKICNQIVVASTVVALAEAINLARHSDIDIPTLLQVLSGGLAASEVLRQKGHSLTTEDFTGGGSATNQLKDLDFALETGQHAEAALPLTTTLAGLFERMVKNGDGELDHLGIYRTIASLTSQEKA